MYDKNQRQNWPWEEVAKVYETHRQDNLLSVTQKEYTKAYTIINKTITVPRDRWLSIQILNRTIWTNFKQYLSESNRPENNENLNYIALCKNCGEHDEHTNHIFVQCNLAKLVWEEIEKAITFAIIHTKVESLKDW